MKDKYSLIVAGKEPCEIVYEDENFLAFVQEEAIIEGQVTILPKEKYTIFEMMPKEMVIKLGAVTKIISAGVFDGLQCHGTNIFIENGVSAGQEEPYFSVHILPRFENDGLNLDWERQSLEEYEMEDVVAKLNSYTENLDVNKKEDLGDIEDSGNPKVIKEGNTEITVEKDEDNYLVKSLRKIP